MRPRAFAVGLLLLASLSGCGAADAVAPAPPATSAPAAQAPIATSADTLPTQGPTAPTEVPVMQDSPTPLDTPTPPAPESTAQSSPQPPASPTPTRQLVQSTAVISRVPADPAPTPPNAAVVPRPLSPALTAMVDVSRADLAQRQSVPLEDIALVEMWTVVWPDRGLGCPNPDMGYPQVPADGLLIRLGIGERTYDYHTDGQRPPFLCDQKRPAAPLAPAAPAPAGTVAPADRVPPPGNP
jgi:hypothetical protein